MKIHLEKTLQGRRLLHKIEGGLRSRMNSNHQAPAPLVSVITATYNAGEDLEKCIESVLKQDYEQVELIVIDGGSTDATLDIIRKYDQRIEYWISEKDQGVYDALNKGIDVAHGDWLFFLGADDYLAGEQILTNIFSEPQCSKLLYGNVIWGDSGRVYDGKFCSTKLYYRNICQQAIFYHRSLFDDFNRFDLRYPYWSDWAFNMKAFSSRKTKPKYLDMVVSYYCTDGISSNMKDNILLKHRNKIFTECFGRTGFLKVKFGQFIHTKLGLPSSQSKWES